jgi:hypothetical protein
LQNQVSLLRGCPRSPDTLAKSSWKKQSRVGYGPFQWALLIVTANKQLVDAMELMVISFLNMRIAPSSATCTTMWCNRGCATHRTGSRSFEHCDSECFTSRSFPKSWLCFHESVVGVGGYNDTMYTLQFRFPITKSFSVSTR